MPKTFKWVLLMIYLLSGCVFVSCSKDGEPDNNGGNSVSQRTAKAIKDVFPNLRLDSIQSHEDFNNIKITYSKGLLTEYKECYDDGRTNDTYAALTWTKDTVFINTSYKAVIGENGYVSKLLCPKGHFNLYSYDDAGYLTKYNYRLDRYAPDEFLELSWENGNVINTREYYRYYSYDEDPKLYYKDYFYSYGNDENLAGLLPPLQSQKKWIFDSGVTGDVNIVLYYAGLLGKGTRNLPIAASEVYYNTPSKRSYNLIYSINEKGYVDVATSEGELKWEEIIESYFYTE